MPAFTSASLRGDIVGGLVSSAVAIPLALGLPLQLRDADHRLVRERFTVVLESQEQTSDPMNF
jgi:hypothetical protein